MDTIETDDLYLPYLVTFSVAAELSNFSRTAKIQRLSQAAISQRVQALERAVGKSLFRRNGGRVELTAAGRTLYEYAQRILELHREARRVVGGESLPPSGELLLAASSVPGEYLLPDLIASFGQQYPHLRVNATVTDSKAVIAVVERGEASLGLVGSKSGNSDLEFRHLASDRMVLAVPSKHPLGIRKRVPIGKLAGYALILREQGSGLRACFEKSLQRVGRSLGELKIALELGSNEGIKAAVQRGVGVAVLSAYAVQNELRSGAMRVLELSDLDCDREIFVVRDKRRVLPLPARLFLTFLEKHPMHAGPPSL